MIYRLIIDLIFDYWLIYITMTITDSLTIMSYHTNANCEIYIICSLCVSRHNMDLDVFASLKWAPGYYKLTARMSAIGVSIDQPTGLGGCGSLICIL